MKIAFDVSQAGTDRIGCGYFAYSLAREMLSGVIADDIKLLRTFGSALWDPDHREIDIPAGPHTPDYLATFDSLPDQAAFWSARSELLCEMLGHPDIIHSNSYFSPPYMHGTRQIYTLYDMAVFERPEFTTPAYRAISAQGIMQAAGSADALIAISEFTRTNFLRYFPFAEDRVFVVPLASRLAPGTQCLRPAGLRPSSRFILAVGTIEPRKNLDLLLEALRRLPDHADLTLVIAGRLGWNMDNFSLAPAALGLGARVQLLSYVSDEELAWLYANCVALVHPSLWEGFGLPVIEAMAHGCAVISSNTTSLPEVVGDAAMLFDPADAGNLVAQIRILVDHPAERQRLREKALERARHFSWKKTATMVRAVYEEVHGRPQRQSGGPRASGLTWRFAAQHRSGAAQQDK